MMQVEMGSRGECQVRGYLRKKGRERDCTLIITKEQQQV